MSVRTTSKWWGNVIFAIRQSDINSWIYAFGSIDAAVSSLLYYPPVEAINDQNILNNWINSNPTHLKEWRSYYNSMINLYPDDAIRPQHSAILLSKDFGESWEIIYRIKSNGFQSAGYFFNGECSTTCQIDGVNKTIVITEGKHKYVSSGIDCSGDVLIKLNSTNIINRI